jgi:hypothetical protein
LVLIVRAVHSCLPIPPEISANPERLPHSVLQ